MITTSGLTIIKWAGSNTVLIEIQSNNARLYLTKNEAVDLIEAVTMFIDAYPEDFSSENINKVDIIDDQWDWTSTHG